MRVNRRFLYAGVFLLAVGAVLVVADLNLVATPILLDALRLWPLALVALGVGIVVRRTQFGLGGGMLAAAVPGLVLGSALAATPRFVGDCGERGEASNVATRDGSFVGPASVSVTSGCGTLTIRTAPGTGWRFDATNTAGRTPVVEASAQALSIVENAQHDWRVLNGGRNTWDLTLPAGELSELSVTVEAGRSVVNLPGARLHSLALEANAGEFVVDASGASIAEIAAELNLGVLSIHLPEAADVTGSIEVGGGELQVCTSPGTGLRVRSHGTPFEVNVEGIEQDGSTWQSSDYATATHRADLDVEVDFGVIEINPIGGCK
jgi:hypothetical protein